MKVQLYIVCVYIRTYEADLFFVRVESNCYRWSEEEVSCDQNTLQFSVPSPLGLVALADSLIW